MKYLTISVDDGLIESARKIDRLLGKDKATFFLTTGWVLPNTVPVEDQFNVGRDHGSLEEWQELSHAGHDIGSHSVSHRVPEYLPENERAVRREYVQSLKFIQQIHDGPYSVATPFNSDPPPTLRLDTLYQAVRLGEGAPNNLGALNFSAIHTLDQDTSLDGLPDDSWAVFALHGIDEGYRPIGEARFCEMVTHARELGWVIRTMKEMIVEFRCRRPSSFNGWVDRLEWSGGQASADQERMMRYLKSIDLKGRKILHVGTGNSQLGLQCAATAEVVDTISISPREIETANSFGLRNYTGFVCDKYQGDQLLGLPRRRYDLILDNNVHSFACCRHHFFEMMRTYFAMLEPGGAVLVDEPSLYYTEDWLDREEWSLSAERLSALGASLGFTVRQVSVDQLALEPTSAQSLVIGKWPTSAIPRPTRQRPLNPFEIPIVINSRDQLASLRQLVDWVLQAGYVNVKVLDNASTFPQLVDYLASIERTVSVTRLNQNLGPHSLWKQDNRARLRIEGPFVYTDPDVVPISECPKDVVGYLLEVLMSRPGCGMVGLGLKIDDLPDTYHWKDQVVAWESKFWRRPVGRGLYYAAIDTTFALHGVFSKPPARGIRTGYPYLARHLPWYSDSEHPSEEAIYYARLAQHGASNWNAGPPPPAYRECVAIGIAPSKSDAARQTADVKIALRTSGLFDERYYLASHQDVAAAGVDPLDHYVTFGAAEGRDPHPLFDTSFYLEQNPEVAASGVNPLAHYLFEGAASGRDPHPLFDTSFYFQENAEVAASGVNPLAHFLGFGGRERRNPHPLFDTAFYLEQQSDVAASGMNPLVHFVLHGGRERRSPHPLFDSTYYLQQNPDIATIDNPLLHYVLCGARERRVCHPFPGLFDLSLLLAAEGVPPR